MNWKPLLIFVFASIFLAACSDEIENPAPAHEEEFITTVKLNFIERGSNDTISVFARDLDGDGGSPVEISEINLKKETTYSFSVEVLDESNGTAVKDITQEIYEEGEDHQFFFEITPPALASHTYSDKDKNGRPIGIKNAIATSSAGKGTLKVVLKHQVGLKSATSTIDVGGTDVEQTFLMIID